MAASVSIYEWNGTSGSQSSTAKESGTVRYQAADRQNVDTTYPLAIPSSGQTYSYEKWLTVSITGGTFTEVSNVRYYTDGSNGFVTGVKLWGATDSSYSTPVAPSTSNDPPQHDAVGMTNVFTYTSGSPLTIGSGTYTTTGICGNYLVSVMEVETTASASGSTNSETFTFAYDEI